ncbi:MAG TPA: VCBS repeat-containing protein [Thermoanaerobaculia bacterium]|nr:VCBS repeat-containing protein [Thermoanaerobaculia bacterium]
MKAILTVLSLIAMSAVAEAACTYSLAAPRNYVRNPHERELAGIGSIDMKIGDVNGDGADDPVFQQEDGRLQVAINDGSGNFTLETLPRTFGYLDINISISAGEIAVVDMGHPGYLDPVHVFRRNAAGAWTEERVFDTAASIARTRDLNGDGRSEIVLVETGPPQESQISFKILKVVSGVDDGIFFEAPLGRFMVTGIAIDDVTGDGPLDLVVSASYGDPTGPYPAPRDGFVQLFAGRGDGTFETGQTIASNVAPFLDPMTGDFNGDGRRDIAFVTGHRELFLMYGTGSGFATKLQIGGAINYVRPADLNRDGITDFVAGFDGVLTVWLGSPDHLTLSDMYWSSDTVWNLARLGVGAPYSLISVADIPARVIDAQCVSSRRRSIGR